jgi:hypothetical protein
MKFIFAFVLSLGIVGVSTGQPDTVVNPNSTEKIPYYEQLYRFRVWRIVDLMEKQNMSFKSVKSDIASFLLSNIQNGKLPIYNETVEVPSDPAIALVLNKVQDEPPYNPAMNYIASEKVSYGGKNYESLRSNNKGNLPTDPSWWQLATEQTEYVTPVIVKGITVVEDMIFDKRRSRLYYDIQAIGIMADKGDGTLTPVAFVKYKDFYDLVEQAAHDKDMKVRDMVMWRNRYNPSENRTFTDAFKLRLFHGIIDKVENPDDLDITRIYSDNGRTYGESVFARWEAEMKLMEKEHNLWEY